jgi:hypothetical protein
MVAHGLRAQGRHHLYTFTFLSGTFAKMFFPIPCGSQGSKLLNFLAVSQILALKHIITDFQLESSNFIHDAQAAKTVSSTGR